MARFAAFVACFFSLAFPANAAIVSSHQQRSVAAGTHAAARFSLAPTVIQKKMANMTLDKAMALLEEGRQTPAGLTSMVQGVLGVHKGKTAAHHDRVSKRSLRGETSSHAMATDDPEEEEYGSGGVSAAEDMLSELIADAQLDLDATIQSCTQYHEETSAELETTRQNIATQNARSAGAKAREESCTAELDFLEVKIPRLQQQLKDHREQCEVDMEAIRGQLDIIASDREVIDRIVNMSACAEPEDETTTALLQEPHVKCCTAKEAHGRVSFLMATNSGPLGQLKSPVAKWALESMFPNVMATFMSEKEVSLSQVGSDMGSATQYMVIGGHNLTDYPVGVTPVQKAVVCPDQQKQKCNIAGSSNCPKIRQNFLDIQSEIIEKTNDLKNELAETEFECSDFDKILSASIEKFEKKQNDEDAELTKAQGVIQTCTENLRELQNELGETTEAYHAEFGGCEILYGELQCEVTATSGRCAEKIDGLTNQLCGLKKIRIELRKINGDNTTFMSDIIDCEVGEWEPKGDCDKTCGYGRQKMWRKTLQAPSPGASCPPLESEVDCAEFPCPIDCVLNEWSEWTSCTVSCNGGMRDRERTVKVEPFFDGLPCEETIETERCNLGACDVNCELEEWSEWCGCDKLCNGGSQKRFRGVQTEAIGNGYCASSDDDERLEYQDCNTMSCEELLMLTPQHPYVECKEAIDIILVLDGSGSLDEEGWDATVQFAITFAKALELGAEAAELAALVFSGPSGSTNAKYCRGELQPPSDWDVMDGCGMHWVQHYTSDMDEFKAAIGEKEWPRGGTWTHMALEMAIKEFAHGRDVPTVVIVVTDGKPNNVEATKEAAKEVKKSARLMMALVGSPAIASLYEVEEMVSAKKEHNILEVKNFTELSSPHTINNLISDFCTDLVAEGCPYEVGTAACPWGPTKGSSCGTDNHFWYQADNGNFRRLLNNVNSLDEAVHRCGAICDASPNCGGFNYNSAKKKCFFRKVVTTDNEVCSNANENTDNGATCVRKADPTCVASVLEHSVTLAD